MYVIEKVDGARLDRTRRVGISPPNVHALEIPWPSKTRSGGGRGYMWCGPDMGFEVVGGRDAEIRRGVGVFHPKWQILGVHAQYCLAIENV